MIISGAHPFRTKGHGTILRKQRQLEYDAAILNYAYHCWYALLSNVACILIKYNKSLTSWGSVCGDSWLKWGLIHMCSAVQIWHHLSSQILTALYTLLHLHISQDSLHHTVDRMVFHNHQKFIFMVCTCAKYKYSYSLCHIRCQMSNTFSIIIL